YRCADELEATLDRAERRVDRALYIRIADGRALLQEKAANLWVAAAGERGDGGELFLLAAPAQARRGQRTGERLTHVCVLLCRERLGKGRDTLGARMLQRFFRRAQPLRGVVAEEGEPTQRALDRAAKPIVDAYLVERIARRLAQWRIVERLEKAERAPRRLRGDQLVLGRCAHP